MFGHDQIVARPDPAAPWVSGTTQANVLVGSRDADHDGAVAGVEVTAYETRIVPEILQGGGQRQGALVEVRRFGVCRALGHRCVC